MKNLRYLLSILLALTLSVRATAGCDMDFPSASMPSFQFSNPTIPTATPRAASSVYQTAFSSVLENGSAPSVAPISYRGSSAQSKHASSRPFRTSTLPGSRRSSITPVGADISIIASLPSVGASSPRKAPPGTGTGGPSTQGPNIHPPMPLGDALLPLLLAAYLFVKKKHFSKIQKLS